MSKNIYTGINIQWPISDLILNGKKIIETRTYSIPKEYLNLDMVMIETPGKKGKFKARIVAIIRFTECIEYSSKEEFYKDIDKHYVAPDSEWAWTNKKKFGWKVSVIKVFEEKITLNKIKGIVFTKGIQI